MTLNQKEWVAVFVAMFVVGFFFIFGQGMVSLFTSNSKLTMAEVPKITTQDIIYGTGETAMPGSRITVNYVGKFEDGAIFDSSLSRNEPFQFVLGAGQVIKGWDEGIVGMRVGGKRTLTIPPSLGYGATNYGPIPGNSTLTFEVELIKVEK